MSSVTIEQTAISCWCGVGFTIPDALFNHYERKNDQRLGSMTIYCPLGHAFTRVTPQPEVKRLKDELARKTAQADQWLADVHMLEKKVERMERKLTRVHRGTCPECRRSFANLASHMKTKHKSKV